MGKYAYEPQHDKTNKMAFAPSEDSDQPGHPPSLIRLFAVSIKKATQWAHSEDWSLWPDDQADLNSSLGTQSFCWFWHEAAHISMKLSISSIVIN